MISFLPVFAFLCVSIVCGDRIRQHNTFYSSTTGRLDGTLTPLHYILKLTPIIDPDHPSYSSAPGEVIITVECNQATRSLVLKYFDSPIPTITSVAVSFIYQLLDFYFWQDWVSWYRWRKRTVVLWKLTRTRFSMPRRKQLRWVLLTPDLNQARFTQ